MPTKPKKTIIQQIKSFLKRPSNICALYLGSMIAWGGAVRIISDSTILSNILFLICIAIFFNLYIPWFLTKTKVKLFNTTDSIISTLILIIILDPSQPLWMIILVCSAIILIRAFFRYKSMPIFNPVAAGVGLVSLLTFIPLSTPIEGPFISWWGTSFAPRFTDYGISIASAFTVVFGIYFLYKFRKIVIFVTAYIFTSYFYFCAQFIFKQQASGDILTSYLYRFFEGTLFFALLLMLIEPKSSPNDKIDQVGFGIIFALGWVIVPQNQLIYGILAANAFNFSVKYLKSHKIILFTKKRIAASGAILMSFTIIATAIVIPTRSFATVNKAAVDNVGDFASADCKNFQGMVDLAKIPSTDKIGIKFYADGVGDENLIGYDYAHVKDIYEATFNIPISSRVKDDNSHLIYAYALDQDKVEHPLANSPFSLKCETPPSASITSSANILCLNKEYTFYVHSSGDSSEVQISNLDGTKTKFCSGVYNIDSVKNITMCQILTSKEKDYSLIWKPTEIGKFYIGVNAYKSNSKCTFNPFYEVGEVAGWSSCGPSDSRVVTVKECK